MASYWLIKMNPTYDDPPASRKRRIRHRNGPFDCGLALGRWKRRAARHNFSTSLPQRLSKTFKQDSEMLKRQWTQALKYGCLIGTFESMMYLTGKDYIQIVYVCNLKKLDFISISVISQDQWSCCFRVGLSCCQCWRWCQLMLIRCNWTIYAPVKRLWKILISLPRCLPPLRSSYSHSSLRLRSRLI